MAMAKVLLAVQESRDTAKITFVDESIMYGKILNIEGGWVMIQTQDQGIQHMQINNIKAVTFMGKEFEDDSEFEE